MEGGVWRFDHFLIQPEPVLSICTGIDIGVSWILFMHSERGWVSSSERHAIVSVCVCVHDLSIRRCTEYQNTFSFKSTSILHLSMSNLLACDRDASYPNAAVTTGQCFHQISSTNDHYSSSVSLVETCSLCDSGPQASSTDCSLQALTAFSVISSYASVASAST